MTPSDADRRELERLARRIVAGNRYLTLATADAAGRPRSSSRARRPDARDRRTRATVRAWVKAMPRDQRSRKHSPISSAQKEGPAPKLRKAVFGSTPRKHERHFIGWVGEVDPDELFATGKAWGISVSEITADAA